MLRRIGAIPGRMTTRNLSPAAQLARVRDTITRWQSGVTEGCACTKCAILRAAIIDMTDALDGSDPLNAGVG